MSQKTSYELPYPWFSSEGSGVPTPGDILDLYTGTGGGQFARNWNQMLRGMVSPWISAIQSSAQAADTMLSRGSESGCCRTCEEDSCHCRCCVADADLIVNTRLGERRVVPIVIENNVRRERSVELQLSDWTDHANANVQMSARFVTPTKFTLEPCGEHSAVLVIDVQAEQGDDERFPDVADCQVYYADVRIKGCDHRSIRIAVTVLPRDCKAFRVDCRQCCC